MQKQNKKGFLLLDSLISVFVTCLVCGACYSIYNLMLKYDEGYVEYQKQSNENLEEIYWNISDCEECIIDESN